jgi:polysaccharide deacetylase family protein (PEP-CTERM system associated)
MEKLPRVLNALTVDVEDYFHVTAFEGRVTRREWDLYPSRVVANTQRLLRLLERHDVRATFFVLGWVGQRFPALVREIAVAGHEVGCHSYWHRQIYRMTPDEFREDCRLARDVLEDASGVPVTAYRAPSWSITRKSLWALPILAEEGFRSDSSIFPIYHDRYGIPEARAFPYRIESDGGPIWEFPPSVYRFVALNLPVSGGGYFRVYPGRMTAYFIGEINRRFGQPFMFYVHPWELDPAQPRVPAPLRVRWRHYINLAATEAKLAWLLGRFRFGPMKEALQLQALPSIPTPVP